MAKAFFQKISKFRNDSHLVARASCRLIDELRSVRVSNRAELLDDLQLRLRGLLVEAERDINEWAARAQKRPARLKALKKRLGGGSSAIGEHLDLGKAFGEVLDNYRNMIRQIGDAIAWIVLRENPRMIYPLYATRTQQLTPGVGLYGVAQVIIELHKSGQFFAVDNDLTRCLGSGDITAVRSDGRWSMPLSIECKTVAPAGTLVEGTEVTINMASPVSSDSLHQEQHQLLSSVLNANVGQVGRVTQERDRRQIEEMTESAEALLAAIMPRPQLNTSGKAHWISMRNTIARALQTGGSYHFPEPGIAFLAVRNRAGEQSLKVSENLLDRLRTDGFLRGDHVLTLSDFIQEDALSAVIPPIALWPLPLEYRASLLSGNIFFACVFKANVWADAMKRVGVTLTARDDEWLVRVGDQTGVFDHLERLKLAFGVAFGGVSPEEVARAILQKLSSS